MAQTRFEVEDGQKGAQEEARIADEVRHVAEDTASRQWRHAFSLRLQC